MAASVENFVPIDVGESTAENEQSFLDSRMVSPTESEPSNSKTDSMETEMLNCLKNSELQEDKNSANPLKPYNGCETVYKQVHDETNRDIDCDSDDDIVRSKTRRKRTVLLSDDEDTSEEVCSVSEENEGLVSSDAESTAAKVNGKQKGKGRIVKPEESDEEDIGDGVNIPAKVWIILLTFSYTFYYLIQSKIMLNLEKCLQNAITLFMDRMIAPIIVQSISKNCSQTWQPKLFSHGTTEW